MKSIIMTTTLIVASLSFSSATWAFSCPAHFKEAQTAINNATTSMQYMTNKGNSGLVHTLIDDAKMYLKAAQHHHEKPAAGNYDHARSLAKADSARAYADAAAALAKR